MKRAADPAAGSKANKKLKLDAFKHFEDDDEIAERVDALAIMLEEDEDKLRAAGELENGFEATVRGGVPVIVCKACDKAVASSTTAVTAKAVKS